MHALIHGERIAQISANTFPVAPPLHWVDAPEGVTTRHTYVDGAFVAPPGPPAPAMRDYQDAIEAHVEATARERDYSSAVSLASYYNSTVEPWASEAQAFVPWRDAVWQHAYAELDKVAAGEREQPTIEALIGELPTIDWPALD